MKQTKSEILNYHLNLYNYLKNRAKAYETETSAELKSFQQNQVKLSKRDFQISDFKEITKAIKSSDVMYLGDFHTFDQNSRNLERLIKVLLRDKKNLILGVELVMQENQKYIDEFLQRNITEKEFLQLIQYHESWRFPWPQYKIFFDLAREHNFSILALNTTGSLKDRDHSAAKLISQRVDHSPNLKMIVLFGELHIAPNKIPKLVKKYTKKNFNHLIIHQNLDEVYWKMQDLQIPEKKVINNIVKFNEHEFSLQTAPPWVKYESMIYWFEQMAEDPDYDIHEYVMNTGLKQISDDTHENFNFLAQKLNQVLKLNLESKDIEDFLIYDHTKISSVLNQIDKVDSLRVKKFYKRLLNNGRLFKTPKRNIYYCSNYSINRLTFLAGMHVYLTKIKKVNQEIERFILGKSQFDKYLYFFHLNLFSYLSSKIFNPYRKCNLYLNYLDIPANERKNTTSKVIEIIDAHYNESIANNREFKNILKGIRIYDLYKIGHKIGQIAGENIYKNFFNKKYNKIDLTELIFNPHLHHSKYFKLVGEIINKSDLKSQRKRYF